MDHCFNTSLNVEKTINEKWKAGIAYGVGSSNLNNFNLSGNTVILVLLTIIILFMA